MTAAATIPAPPPEMDPVLFGLRDGRPSDHSYVIESWLTCTAHSGAARGMRPALYKFEAKRTFVAILARPGVTLRIAHVPEDDDAILGWAVYQTTPAPAVFYVYVRKPMWGNGVARSLLAPLIPLGRVDYAFDSPPGTRLPIPPAWDFNPTRLYR